MKEVFLEWSHHRISSRDERIELNNTIRYNSVLLVDSFLRKVTL